MIWLAIAAWLLCGLAGVVIDIKTSDDYNGALSVLPDLFAAPILIALGPIFLILIVVDRFF